ncbi:uncharacterized protein LOC114302527 [Camellia sinensis]|uniref:uncharacterized protein LOC114302527 n=1 Tax=Camellia sinensis TaxID=4442 RepID=UPI001036DB53|nr:uncharacterized protein LOC114302527 [Camellia sinensis]
MYLDGVETLFNRPERNYDMGDRGLGLAVFTQTVRPFGLMTKDILPECDPTVPWTLYDVKKFLRDLGLGYETIHSCKNDCALFWKESVNLEKCPTCDACRYKLNDDGGKKIPHKVLRYFPLTPRLKILYMSKKTAADMRWHNEKRVDDDILRHPADGEAWKDFDKQHPTFSDDSRNVRLGLATDGFNPFGNMSTLYSMWPVILMPYNLPPWRMHAAVMWTINDFPAYGNMSGWSTKGYLACPNCNNNASSQGLRSKIGYMGARRHLPENHTWRTSKLFNGQTEHRSKPLDISGDQILEQIDSGTYKPYGKHPQNRKRQRNEHQNLNRSKRSIMFDLPYWKTLKLRHNLDVMHIEKNICDNVVGTLLSVDRKNKDMDKARLDLEDMKIRNELHLKRRSNGSFEKPPAFITLPSACKIRLLGRLKGFVANKDHPEGSIAEAYISKECTTFCSMYLDRVETLFNRPERNYDMGDRGLGLAVFTQTVRPFGLMTRASDVFVAERELAHWSYTIAQKWINTEHKNLLHQRAGAFDIENKHRKEFPKWFKDHMNELRSQVSPEATDDMWSLANGPRGLVNTHSGCICNGVRYHTIDCDNRRKSQNCGLVVEGEHQGQLIHFYGHLCRVWELNYLFRRRIVLFQCEWFNTGSSRTMRVEPHFTTVDITSRWYKDDSFILPSQVEQVFYVNDTKLGTNWRVVEKFQHRRIWDVPEMDVVQPGDVFQQEETTEVVPTMAINDDVVLRRHDIKSEIIPMEVLQSVRVVEAKGVIDDAFICDDEDGLMREGDDTDEEYDLQSDFDTDVDVES